MIRVCVCVCVVWCVCVCSCTVSDGITLIFLSFTAFYNGVRASRCLQYLDPSVFEICIVNMVSVMIIHKIP